MKNRSIGGGMSPMNSRHAILNQKTEISSPSNGLLGSNFSTRGVNSSSPIRLNVNRLIFIFSLNNYVVLYCSYT